jgi:peptidoglycan/xylan/chitin deacetylase (PgdA/CDA1 family)
MRVVSFMYHDVVGPGAFDSSGFITPGADRYKLDSDEFERHLQAIAGTPGLRSTILRDCPVESQNQQLLITFDDGGVSCYTIIADMLERYSLRGHFFVTTDFIDTPRFLGRRHIRELRSRGHVIGSHSCSHPAQISSCSRLELKKEWSGSVNKLQDILGEPVKVASVPGGFYSKQVAEEAFAAGISTLFTSEPTTRCKKVNDLFVLGRYTLKRGVSPHVAAGLANGDWQLRLEQLLEWKAKGMVKKVGGRQYVRLRNKLLAGNSKSSDASA